MSDDFLSRWSRKKHEARRNERATAEAAPATPAGPAPSVDPAQSVVPAQGVAPAQGLTPAQAGGRSPDLPPVESLTPESDFAPFMKPDVDPGLRQQALKTLFRDPRHNIMDRLDVYIDDYSQPDPLPEGWLEKMTQTARLGDYKPPQPEAPVPAEETPQAPVAEPENARLAGEPDVSPVETSAPPDASNTLDERFPKS